MPGNKRWYLEVTIFLIRDGKEICHRNDQTVGPIKELFYGSDHPQAKTFKVHAIQV